MKTYKIQNLGDILEIIEEYTKKCDDIGAEEFKILETGEYVTLPNLIDVYNNEKITLIL